MKMADDVSDPTRESSVAEEVEEEEDRRRRRDSGPPRFSHSHW